MTNKKPIILCGALVGERFVVNRAYATAIKKSGGMLIMLANDTEQEDIPDLFDHIDGLLLTGGTDVNPALYGEEKKEYTIDSDNYRDIVESFLIEGAMIRKLPILAICRGLQILNVKLGGTLYQDIKIEKVESIEHDRHSEKSRSFLAHEVSLKEGSLIKSLIGKEKIETNSLHHQGIKVLAKDLIASATAPDGLIEAVEMPSYPFLLGTQWHPEELLETVWKNIFDSFVKACQTKT